MLSINDKYTVQARNINLFQYIKCYQSTIKETLPEDYHT